MKLFITGATGFLGKYLLEELHSKYETIYVLTRKTHIPELEKFENIVLVNGDITSPEIIHDSALRTEIRHNTDHILHAAAFYDLTASHAECYLQNVVGTQNLLNLSLTFKQLKAFLYISTIAVADEERYFLEENQLPKREKFKDHYSRTKYFAEKLVREHRFQEGLLIRIMRPGIIVGNSTYGNMDKIDGPYYFIEAFRKHAALLKSFKFIPLSYSSNTKMPIIPVDHCARFISLAIERMNPQVKMETYHLISEEVPSIADFLSDLKECFHLNTKFIPVPKNLVHDNILHLLGIPKEVIPFMFSKITYDKTVTNRLLPEILESKYSLYKTSVIKK